MGEIIYDYPVNSVVQWTKALSEIPDGWALCDGANGTKDLTDKFVRGAQSDSDVGNTGGSNLNQNVSIPSHTHDVYTGSVYSSSWNHEHGIDEGTFKVEDYGNGDDFNISSSYLTHDGNGNYRRNLGNDGGHSHPGGYSGLETGKNSGGNSVDNRPPSIKLAFIQKVDD